MFLIYHYPILHHKTEVLKAIEDSKGKIPKDLRLGDTFFKHMTVLGKMEMKQMATKNSTNRDDLIALNVNPHMDKGDIVTALFHVGNVSKGGKTIYYNGKNAKNKGDIIFSQPFQHGNLTVGFYSSVLHAVESWEGQRGSFVLNLKSAVLEHFRKYGDQFYQKYVWNGYPQKTFCSDT